MKTFKLFLFLLCGLMASKVSAQDVKLNLNKSLSDEDKTAVEKILQDFDPSTYSFVANEGKAMKLGNAKGLGNVKQTKTRVMVDKNKMVARTNTQYNIFKELARTNTQYNVFKTARTNTQYNIFKELARTNTQYNVFKPTDAQVSKMDELFNILVKYQ